MSTLTTVIIVWVCGGLTFLGIGLVVHRSVGRSVQGWDRALSACWLGWAGTIVYLQLWHLVHAIDAASAVIPIIFGASGLLAEARRSGLHFAGLGRVQRTGRLLLLAGAGVLWVALLAVGSRLPYDAGLYHLQTIKWLNAYPVVPGLGDLHGRLAYNSSFFLYVALLNVGPLTGQAPRLANGFLALLLLAQLGTASVRLIERRGEGSAADYLRTLLLLPTLAAIGSLSLANTSPDVTVLLLEIVVAVEVLDLLRGRPAEMSGFAGFRVALLVGAGIVVKLSFAPFGISCLLLTTWALRLPRKALAVMAATLAAVLGPWMVHGIVLSGYPVYPIAVGGLPFDWRVSPEAVALEASWISGWARDPGPNAVASLQTWSWVGPWLARQQEWLASFVLLAVVATVLGARSLWRSERTTEREFLLLFPVGVGLAGWFILAPDPRFAGALFWLAGLVPALAIRLFRTRRARLGAAGLVVATALIPGQLVSLAVFFVLPVLNLTSDSAGSVLPVVPLQTIATDSGLLLYVPAVGDQAWDAPLPSTPYPDSRLELRCPDTLACGFRLQKLATSQ